MDTIIKYLSGTPMWVYVVFAFFLVSGIKALKSHNTSIKKMFIVPVALMIFSWMTVESRSLLLWIPIALVGGWLGWKWMKTVPLKVNVKNLTVLFPGSPFPLILFLGIFAIRYFFGALQAVAPETFLQWALYQSLFSGALTGICFGRIFYIWRIFQKEVKNSCQA